MKKFLSACLVLTLILSLVPVRLTPAAAASSITAAPQVSLKLNSKKVQLTVGETFKLELVSSSDDSLRLGGKTLTYKSSNKKIVKVSKKGTVTAVAPGSTKVTVKYNGKSYKCKFTVKAKDLYPSEEEILKKINELKKSYPDGYSFSRFYEREWFGFHTDSSWAVTSEMNDQIFGDLPLYGFDAQTYPELISPGCLIVIGDAAMTHGIVTAVNGDEITYVGAPIFQWLDNDIWVVTRPKLKWGQTVDVSMINDCYTRRSPQSVGLDKY